MSTHPVPPDDPDENAAAEAGAPNPSHLPVEPEFAPAIPSAEPEAPMVRPQAI